MTFDYSMTLQCFYKQANHIITSLYNEITVLSKQGSSVIRSLRSMEGRGRSCDVVWEGWNSTDERTNFFV